MRVAVTGATGVIGAAAVPALVEAGHEVIGMARTPEKADWLTERGAEPARCTLSDHDALVEMFRGADAVCNFATRVPVGYAALRPRAWRTHDRLRTEGVRRVVAAAHEAGVRRVVQESVSTLYADQGDAWIVEDSPLAITAATEPAAVGESHVQSYACGSRAGVVLRLGTLLGDEPLTRLSLRAAERGHAIGLGSPEGWAHVLHTDDLGPAVLGSLIAPSGTYNVGATPVRRHELVRGLSQAAGRDSADFVGTLRVRLAGVRLEPLARSLRVGSEHFTACTGWRPRRSTYDTSWFTQDLPAVTGAGVGVR